MATTRSGARADDGAALRTGFSGTGPRPGAHGYDEARRVWDGVIHPYPTAITRCASTAAADQAAPSRPPPPEPPR